MDYTALLEPCITHPSPRPFMSSVSHCALQHTYTHRAHSIPQTPATLLTLLPWQTTHYSGLKWCYVLDNDMLYNGNMFCPQCPVLLTTPKALLKCEREGSCGYFGKQKLQIDILPLARIWLVQQTVQCRIYMYIQWYDDVILLFK